MRLMAQHVRDGASRETLLLSGQRAEGDSHPLKKTKITYLENQVKDYLSETQQQQPFSTVPLL